jgi:opacity protein-like surface antigen
MFKKMMTMAVLVAGVLSMALPAHAATRTTRFANLGGQGIVTFTQHGYQWTMNTQVTVPAGKHYVLNFTSEETANGGVVGSQSGDVCRFSMAPNAKVAGCHTDGKGLAPRWLTKTDRPDTFIAEIDQIAPDGTRTTVLGPVTLG